MMLRNTLFQWNTRDRWLSGNALQFEALTAGADLVPGGRNMQVVASHIIERCRRRRYHCGNAAGCLAVQVRSERTGVGWFGTLGEALSAAERHDNVLYHLGTTRLTASISRIWTPPRISGLFRIGPGGRVVSRGGTPCPIVPTSRFRRGAQPEQSLVISLVLSRGSTATYSRQSRPEGVVADLVRTGVDARYIPKTDDIVRTVSREARNGDLVYRSSGNPGGSRSVPKVAGPTLRASTSVSLPSQRRFVRLLFHWNRSFRNDLFQ
jgi:hypothetical protein